MKKIFVLPSLLAIMFLALGCSTPSSVVCTQKLSPLKKDFGNSYRLAIENQTLNPEAKHNLKPVSGFDGQVANSVAEKYRKEFSKPDPAPTYMFNINTSN